MNMGRLGRRALLLCVGLLASGGALAQDRTAVILSTASVTGETITCGCQKKELGGIARRASFIKAERAKSPATIVVDAGDFGATMNPEPWMRTEFQYDMMAKMGYDVVTPGPNEMMFGADKLRTLGARAPQIKIVSANIVDKKTQKPLWDEFTLIERGGVRFAVTGVTDANYYKFNSTRGLNKSDDFEFRDPKTSLQRVIPQMRQQADVVVVLLHTGAGDAKRMLDGVSGIDAVTIGHAGEHKFLPEKIASTSVVHTGRRGQYIGRLELALAGNKVTGHSGEVQALGEVVPVDPEFDRVVKAFNKKYDALPGAVPAKALEPAKSPSKK